MEDRMKWMQESAALCFQERGWVPGIFLVFSGDRVTPIPCSHDSEYEKNRVAKLLVDYAARPDVDAIGQIGEVWVIEHDTASSMAAANSRAMREPSAADHPDRKELVMVSLSLRDGDTLASYAEILREPEENPRLAPWGETRHEDCVGRFANYFLTAMGQEAN